MNQCSEQGALHKQCKATATHASLRLCEASLKLALKDVSDSGVSQFCAKSVGFLRTPRSKFWNKLPLQDDLQVMTPWEVGALPPWYEHHMQGSMCTSV